MLKERLKARLNRKLFEAIKNGQVDKMRRLIKRGAELNSQNELGQSPLSWAIDKNQIEIVRVLLTEYNLNSKMINNALFDAVYLGDIDIAKLLIENGADINTQKEFGNTSLHLAVREKNFDLVKLLIEYGADVNIKNNADWTPLHWTASNGYYDVAKLLIENGADVNIKDEDGWTPLHEAAFKGNIDIGKCLIENGADPFIKNKNGKTPLDICQNDDIRQLLEKYMEEYHSIQEKIKRNESSIFDNDLLDSAYYNNLIEVKKCVYSGKFDINVQDDKGYTPLMHAITNHNLQMVEFLVEHGADINLCNNKGQSPLKIAYLYDSKEIAEYLFLEGAVDKNVEDRKQDNVDKT